MFECIELRATAQRTDDIRTQLVGHRELIELNLVNIHSRFDAQAHQRIIPDRRL